jgi:peptide/nickel transport system substrate-binding protein
MNDLLVQTHAVIPVIQRRSVAAVSNKLVAPVSAWVGDMGFLRDWYRT